ncbi:winged helix-turn-helix domain-containing protein [Sporichthya polymorpha]|uniref:winged helix-turn-helix domain-containing protein n=1 Tax=Sporichthya polymorpha TaxID=35751 RepID=UPI00036D2DA1|nr:crosslink repair DNA glycosylase YcaQ family protein [Sporichthya polymorpha]
MDSLSAADARRLALRTQGLLGARPRNPAAVLRLLGAVQLDTISVLARSHELVPYARLGPVGRPAVERAFWSGACVEYWSHAACILPVETWPLYSFRRRHFRERGIRWHERPPESVFAEVRARLADGGPVTTGDIGGAKKGGPWWDWSGQKIAIEFLLDTGEVVCTRRVEWRRVYDLAERALPAEVLAADTLDDTECHRRLVAAAGAAMGVATAADLADYPRISRADVEAVLPDTGLIPVAVEGWSAPAWADAAALAQVDARGRHRTTLLSPFDSLIWDRKRTLRLFGFSHALEAYKPAAKRDYGYFTMPLLAGGRLLGRVDPKRIGTTLAAQAVFLDTPAAVAPMAAALWEAAAWVGCDSVSIDRVEPVGLADRLHAALTDTA